LDDGGTGDSKTALMAFLAEQVTPFLSPRGFRRRGQRYSALQGRNSVFVRFQRRADFFTCDLGFINATLWEAGFQFPPEHWTVRLGGVAVGYDKWWDLATEPASLATDFLPALARGLEHIEPLAADEGFRARLLADAASGQLRPFEAGWLVTLQRAHDGRATRP
jgi:hypothetical protein